MNILFYFISQINPRSGGTERVADNVAHGLRRRGHSVFYMSRTSVPGDYDVPCFFLPDKEGITQRNIDYVNRFCQEHCIDVIINEAGNTDDIYLMSKEHIHGVSIITELHFCPYQNFKYYYRSTRLPLSARHPWTTAVNLLKWIKTPFNKRMHWRNTTARYRYMYDHSDRVVVLSPSYIGEFAEIAGLRNTDRLCSIYNPNTFVASTKTCAKEKMVLSIGRLDFSPKKVDYLLRIWKKVQPKHPDWILSVCGDGPARLYLENIVRKECIAGVRFEGNVSPQTFYERASIMCMTSIYEGTPMVIIEAMQCGCVPMVYDTYAAARDMINDGTDGFVIPPFDEVMYAKKLAYLMDNASVMAKMKHNAMQSSKRFDCNIIIEQWEKLLSNSNKQL